MAKNNETNKTEIEISKKLDKTEAIILKPKDLEANNEKPMRYYGNRISYKISNELNSVISWADLSCIPDKSKKDQSKCQFFKKRSVKLTILIVGTAILILTLVFIILFGLVPCSLTICHSKASTCINYPFYAQCVCDYGYNGNGREYCDECGKTYYQQNARVVGGSTAVPFSWPSAALIVASYKTEVVIDGKTLEIDINFMCGGTLINRKTIITAAHCVIKDFNYDHNGRTYQIFVEKNKFYPTEESMYRVYLGVHNRTLLMNDSIYPAVSIPIKKIIVHENFDTTNIVHDVALFKLKTAVELNDHVQLGCLPNPKWTKRYPLPSQTSWVLGWGTLTEGGTTPEILNNVRITVYENSICDPVLPMNVKNWDSQMCAGDIEGGKDTCQGDSGGPLFVRDTVNNKPKYILAGIVSYGDGCAKPLKPGLYTRTSYYLDWITKNANF